MGHRSLRGPRRRKNPLEGPETDSGPPPLAKPSPSRPQQQASPVSDGRQQKPAYARKTVTVPLRRLQFQSGPPSSSRFRRRTPTPQPSAEGPVASRLRGRRTAPLEKRHSKRARTLSSSPELQRTDEATRRAKRGCRRWRCPYCEKEFSVKDTLNNHMLGTGGPRAQPPCWKFREVERFIYLQRIMPKAPIWIGGAADGGDLSMMWSRKCQDRGVHLWHTDQMEAAALSAAYGSSSGGAPKAPPTSTHRTVGTQTPWRVVIVENKPVAAGSDTLQRSRISQDVVDESVVGNEAEDVTFKQRLHAHLGLHL